MRLLIIPLIVLLIASCNSKKNSRHVVEPAIAKQIDGEQLFKVNCSQCHNAVGELTAPALAGVESRWKSKELLYAFVKHSEDVIARDAYAQTLYKKWNQAYMQPFTHLSNADIDAILAYCNAQAKK